jgi:putative transposase
LLHANISQLTLKNVFLEGALQGRTAERKAMIDPKQDLPIQQQTEVLEISCSSVYYEPRPIDARDLWLMRRIDELHLNYPFAGSRMLRGLAIM